MKDCLFSAIQSFPGKHPGGDGGGRRCPKEQGGQHSLGVQAPSVNTRKRFCIK